MTQRHRYRDRYRNGGNAESSASGAVQVYPFFRLKADDPLNTYEQTDVNFTPSDVILADNRLNITSISYLERSSSWAIVGATRVYFESTGTLPSPLTEDTPYYLSPNGLGGYDVYPEAESSDYSTLPNILAEETVYPAQHWGQQLNKIEFTDQGTGTHRIYSDLLIKEIQNLTDIDVKLVPKRSGRHGMYEVRLDGAGRKYIHSEITSRDPTATGSYSLRGSGLELNGETLTFQEQLRGKRTIGVIAVVSWDETRQRSIAKTPIFPSGVNTSTGVLTFTGENTHQVTTARKVKLRLFPGGTFPTGLDGTTTYYGRNITTTTVTLHPTAADATNNTNVIVPSDQGAEGFTIVDYQKSGDNERMRFLAEVRKPIDGLDTASLRSNSPGWGENIQVMETDISVTGTTNGQIGAAGRTHVGLVPTTDYIHEVDIWWPDDATAPVLNTAATMTRGTYWMTRVPGSSVYVRLHASLADAQDSIGLATADATCLKFTSAGEGYMRISSNIGRPVALAVERNGAALLPDFWTPDIGNGPEILSFIADYNNPEADVMQTWVYRNGILEGIAEGVGVKGLSDPDTNALDTGFTFLNSPQGHVPFEGKVYEYLLVSSEDAIRPENLDSIHAELLDGYEITPSEFAPYNIFPPVIVGDPINGQTITYQPGTWAGYPTPTRTPQWTRNGSNIPGATNPSYTITEDDVGEIIEIDETASNSQGSDTASSAGVIGSPSASAPVNVVLPSISGPPVDGKTITVNTGVWDAVPQPTFEIQWRRDGVDISGETGLSFSPVSEEGNTITVHVVATNASGSDSATSGGVVILPEGSFTPPDNPNLAVWYDPSDLGSITSSGGLVTKINDKSGNGWDASSTSDAARPTTGTRTINGLNTLDYTPTANELKMHVATHFLGRNDSTVFVVGNIESSGVGQASARNLFRGFSSTDGQRYMIQVVNNLFTARAGSAAVISTAYDTSDHIFALRRTSDVVEFWIDGTLIGSQSGTANTLITEMFFGKQHDGKLGEAVFLSNSATDTEMNEFWNYLSAKWGISL